MSYQVLARKWRPRNFSELAGQEHVVQALTNALTRMRLHHAYLLTGTRGVGKTTIARILAKSLNCEIGVTAAPCGTCAACVAIDQGRFVDLIELDAASSTGIDNMREILDTARYAPTVGRYKVYLIDEVHMLSRNAFSSMLKTLEEPPEHVKFVLATTDPQKIPVTVLSRCLQFSLKQLPPPIVARQLEHVLTEEKIPFEPGAIRVLSRAAQGSMRDGLSLLDQAIAYGTGGVEETAVRQMLGAVETDHVLRVIGALADNDGPRLFSEARAMSERNIALDAALQEMCVSLHDIALLQSVPSAIADDHPDRERLAELARKLDAETVQLYYQVAIQGRADLPLAPDEFAGFSMTLLRMLAFAPSAAPGKQVDAGTEVPRAAAPGRTPAAAPQTEPAAARAPGSFQAAGKPLQPVPKASQPAQMELQTGMPTAPVGGTRADADNPAPQRPAANDLKAADALLAATLTAAASGTPGTLPAAFAGAALSSAALAPLPPQQPVDSERLSAAATTIADWPRWVARGGLVGLAQQLANNAELKAQRTTPTGIEVELALAEGNRHLAEKMHQDKLRDALVSTLGVPVRLKIALGGDGESSIAAADRRARQQLQDTASASFNEDPFVRDAVRLFEGRVRPQTIQPVTGQEDKP